MLNSPRVYGQVLASVIGTTSPHVNIRDIKLFSVPKPPLSEQGRIGGELAELRDARFSLDSHIAATSLLLSSAVNSFS
jgi:restriction endonuclease S subunit